MNCYITAMVPVTILLHANVLYAEFPLSEIRRVVETSYIPVLEAIHKRASLAVVLDFSGFTLEVLNGEHPDLFEGSPTVMGLLRELIASGQAELTGTSWAHAILPTMPQELARMDVALFRRTALRILDYVPKGFFPPELGISPLLPRMLQDEGYSWSFFDRDLADYTRDRKLNASNDFGPALTPSFAKATAQSMHSGFFGRMRYLARLHRDLSRSGDFSPILWKGAGQSRVIGLPSDPVWVIYSLICLSRTAFYNEKSLLNSIERSSKRFRGLFMPYAGDIEFYGYSGNMLNESIPVKRLERLFDAFLHSDAAQPVLPSDYLAGLDTDPEELYLKSGSWSSDKNFDLWERDPDNAVLNRTAREAYEMFSRLESFQSEAVLKDLLLAWNSDGRGWNPLPEHRLFCLDKALAVKAALQSVASDY